MLPSWGLLSVGTAGIVGRQTARGLGTRNCLCCAHAFSGSTRLRVVISGRQHMHFQGREQISALLHQQGE